MRTWLAATLIGVSLGLYYWLGLTTVAGAVGDDVVYLVLGQDLALNLAYRDLYAPGEPVHVQYPPAYPLLLAAVWSLAHSFPANILAFKALNVGLALAAVALIGVLAARVLALPRWQAGLAAATYALGAGVLIANDLTMSESLFMVTLLLGVCGLERLAPQAEGWGPRRALLVALLATAPMAVRTIGFCLPAAVIAWLCLARRPRHAAMVAAWVLTLVAPWILWVRLGASAQPGADYVSWAMHHTGGLSLRSFVETVSSQLPAAVLTGIPAATAPPLGLLATLGVAVGLLRAAREHLRVWHLFLAAYMLLIIPYPSYGHTQRFLFAVAPLLVLAFVHGAAWPLEAAWRRPLTSPPLRAAAAALTILLLASGLAGGRRVASLAWHGVSHDGLLPPHHRRDQADRAALAAWLSTHTPPEALVISDRPPLWYLWARRQGLGYMAEGAWLAGARLRPEVHALASLRPTYVLAPGLGDQGFTAASKAHPERFKVVYRTPAGSYTAYQVVPD